MLQVAGGEVAGVPSAHVIRLSATGTVSVEGPVEAGGPAIERAAQLLDSLLVREHGSDEFRIPGGLTLVISRALRAIDLPPFTSIESFAEALGRFASTDASAAISHLVVAYSERVAARTAATPGEARSSSARPVEPFGAQHASDERADLDAPTITVSDLRRARRATRLPLSTVAERARIPVALLRQLEWGYLRNWPDGHRGRARLARYARAAGLDEHLVIAVVEPMIEEAHANRVGAVPAETVALVPVAETRLEPRADVLEVAVDEIALAPIAWPTPPAAAAATRRRWTRAALAIPALLALGLLPAWWLTSDRGVGREDPVPTRVATAQPSPPPAPATSARPSSPAPKAAATDTVAPPAAREMPTERPEPAYRPAVADLGTSGGAPVGTAMFYPDGDRDGAVERASADSRNAVLRVTRILDKDSNSLNARMSPDGDRIAFDSDRDGIRGVYVADADGSNVKRVSPEGFAAVPSWSPDGSTLAFVRAEPDNADVWNLWTLDLVGGELTRITNHRYGQPWGGSWFPDGRRIAYTHDARLVVHDLQTGEQRMFASPRPGRFLRTPAVSPDGRRVAFQVQRNGAWLLELTDGSMRKILDDPTAAEYSWAPDGRRLAYYSRRSGEWGVWVMAPR